LKEAGEWTQRRLGGKETLKRLGYFRTAKGGEKNWKQELKENFQGGAGKMRNQT